MIKIEKSKQIRNFLTIMATVLLIFGTTLCYFLGWQVSTIGLLIYLSIILIEIILLLILNFALTKVNKSFYLINSNSIKFVKKNEEMFVLNQDEIVNIHYVRFRWMFLFQMGAGYLHIEYNNDKDYIKPSVLYPNGKKIYSISMSQKQALKIAEVLNKSVTIK